MRLLKLKDLEFIIRDLWKRQAMRLLKNVNISNSSTYFDPSCDAKLPVASVAYQVILESGTGQFREFEPRRVHTRINSLGLFLVHKLTCGKRKSVG